MSRDQTLQLINSYKPYNHDEARNQVLISNFIRTTPQAFQRVHEFGGHVTASGLIINTAGTKVLLNKHKLIGTYMNFGGHADGDEDVFAVAKKELAEEAGITNATTSGNLFDIDIHFIAPHVRKGENIPGHVHYDLNWLFVVDDEAAWTISDESTDIRWFSLEEALKLETNDSQMLRMLTKAAEGIR
ncbi:MAG: NUDIX domain-containing protein [Alphaproteobacteria bacterium]|nr:MAG: NUDIX domain-containing protein [Alphaproteobacteria bacterium]